MDLWTRKPHLFLYTPWRYMTISGDVIPLILKFGAKGNIAFTIRLLLAWEKRPLYTLNMRLECVYRKNGCLLTYKIVVLLYVYVSSSCQVELFGYPDRGFFSCFFLSFKANARAKPAKMGHVPHSSKMFVLCIVCFVSFYVMFLCKCVLYYCHRVATQLQLTNTSYRNWHIIRKYNNCTKSATR
jgi:hypothetical protein